MGGRVGLAQFNHCSKWIQVDAKFCQNLHYLGDVQIQTKPTENGTMLRFLSDCSR